MSYNIIRGIRLNDDTKEVLITSACNNVTPRYYTTDHSTYCENIWKEQGKQALEIELVKAFESGSFQGGSSKYKLAADRLRKMPEYRAFNWRRGGLGDEYTKISEHRREAVAEFDALVLRALSIKEPKEQYVITKKSYGDQVVYFYHRANAGFCRWYNSVTKAKVFKYREDAENMIKGFQNSDDWQVIQIA